MHDFSTDRRRVLAGLAAGAAVTGAVLPREGRGAAAAGQPAGDGLVLPVSAAGGWDSAQVSCPRVLRVGPRDWRMWYYGRDADFDREIDLPTGRIGFARSTDGIRWTRHRGRGHLGALLDPSGDPSRFDSAHLGLGEVRQAPGGFEMWYFGGDRTVIELRGRRAKGFPLRIGRATSKDGLRWTRFDGPHRGAVLDVGPPGAPDAGSVGWPQVVRLEDGRQRMYYHTVSAALGFTVCAAESRDGIEWRRLGVLLGRGAKDAFDADGASTRHVFRRGERWLMLYEGWRGSRLSIGLVESADGLEWKRVEGPAERGAVLAPTPADSGLWDCGAIGTPWLVEAGGGRLHLYYVGRPELAPGAHGELSNPHQVGLAVGDDPSLLRWTRWRA